MEPREIRKLIGKLIMFAFGAYVFFTFIQRTAPSANKSDGGGFSLILLFILKFFWNFCTQWALYLMQGLGEARTQILMILMQLGFFGWTFYSYRFVYFDNMTRDYSLFLSVPAMQYAIIVPLFIMLLFANTRNR